MKLTAKLVGIVIFCICVLQIINGVMLVNGESEILESDLKHDVKRLGGVIKRQVEDVWNNQGAEEALRLLADANSEDSLVKIRLVSTESRGNIFNRPYVNPQRLRQLKHGQEISLNRIVQRGRSYYFCYIPLSIQEFPGAALELSEDLGTIDDHILLIIQRTVFVTILMILAGGLVSIVLGVRMVGRPLHHLAEKARRVGEGDLSGSLALKGHDELTELARTMNIMCDDLADSREKVRAETKAKIAALEQLRHADRLKTIGTISSGMAHEMGTPLNVISGRAGMIAGGRLGDEEVRESAVIIKNQTRRVTNIIQQLLKYTRKRSITKTYTDMPALVNETLSLLQSVIKKQNVQIELEKCEESNSAIPINIDASQIQQVLTNLIVNAIHAVGEKGEITIALNNEKCLNPGTPQDRSETYFRIDIRDNGKGISEENLNHIFDPFFTTKDVGEGTGLGLSIAFGIIEEHDGWIDVQSELGRGSRFSIFLPMPA